MRRGDKKTTYGSSSAIKSEPCLLGYLRRSDTNSQSERKLTCDKLAHQRDCSTYLRLENHFLLATISSIKPYSFASCADI